MCILWVDTLYGNTRWNLESIDFLAENWVFWWPRIWKTFDFWAKNGWKLEMLVCLLKVDRMRQNSWNVYVVSRHAIGELLVQQESIDFLVENWVFCWPRIWKTFHFSAKNGWKLEMHLSLLKLEMLLSLLKVSRIPKNHWNAYVVSRHPIWELLVQFGVNWFFGWKLRFLMTADMANLWFFSQKWVKTWNASFFAKSE